MDLALDAQRTHSYLISFPLSEGLVSFIPSLLSFYHKIKQFRDFLAKLFILQGKICKREV